MSQPIDFNTFLKTYVNTNIAPGSVPYDEHFLVEQLLGELHDVNDKCYSKCGLPVLVSLDSWLYVSAAV